MNIPVEMATPPILPIVIFIVGVVSLIFGVFLLFLGKSRTASILSYVAISLWMILSMVAVIVDSIMTTNAYKDVIAQQTSQIEDAYGLKALDINRRSSPLCSTDAADKSERANAIWSNGYGTIVVGARQGDSCEVNVFEENGKKLEPVK